MTNSRLPQSTPTNNEALEKQIHALVSNLISGQAGVEPLLHTDGVDYVKDIMELIEAYTTKQVVAEAHAAKVEISECFHLPLEFKEQLEFLLKRIDDRIAELTSERTRDD